MSNDLVQIRKPDDPMRNAPRGTAQMARRAGTPAGVMKTERAAWTFLQGGELGRQKWTWRRMKDDGVIETSPSEYPSYAAAVMNAVSQGFRPKSEPYLVESLGRLIRFDPARRPQTLTPRDTRRQAYPLGAGARARRKSEVESRK
jgi:hypothetical protein